MNYLPTPAEWLARIETVRRCDSATVATLEARPQSATVASVALSQGVHPLRLRDGRSLWRLTAGRGGSDTEAAAALVAEAKAAHVFLAADNGTLSICAPSGYRGSLPDRLAAQAADVLAVLHRQSDGRMGLSDPNVEKAVS